MTTRQGEATAFDMDESGEVVCDLIHEDGREEKGVRIRFPAGHRSRPMDDRDGHDMLSMQAGRLLEVVHLAARSVTEALDKVKRLVSGESQFYSVGPKPNGLSLTDDKFLIGLRATKKAARLDDPVDLGTITLVSTVAGAPPIVTLTFTYQDNAGGVPVVFGPFAFPGSGDPVTKTWKLKGKIGPGGCSSLVFIE